MARWTGAIFTVLAAVAFMSTSTAHAQSMTVTLYFTGARSRVIQNCPIFSGVQRVKVQRGGRLLEVLPASLSRVSYNFGKAYEYVGCATNAEGVTKLFARLTKDSPTETLTLSESDFPRGSSGVDRGPETGSLGQSCGSVKSLPGSFIYKTIGSTHFSPGDVRRNTIGLVVEPGVRAAWPTCLAVVDSDGNQVAALGRYEVGGKWSARYYAGIGCGSGTPFNGARVAANARQNTGSESVYIDFGSTCYGPFEADRCVGSSQC